MADVSPNTRNHTHHIKLTGIDQNSEQVTIPLTAVDRDGAEKLSAIRYSGYPTGTPRVNTGDGTFSVKRPPYGEFSRRDWVGGIGTLNSDDDQTKYWFGKRVWSAVPKKLMLAPKLFRSNIAFPLRLGNEPTLNYPVIWVSVGAGTRYAWKVTTTYAMSGVDVLLRTLVDNSFTMEFRGDTAGLPGTLIESSIITDAVLGSNRYQFAESLVAGTYWIIVYGSAAFEVGTCAATDYGTASSADGGATWGVTASVDAPTFFIMSSTGASDWHFFQYKWGTYVASGTQLFLNGDRGACDDNTGNLNKIIDATKAWTVNQFKGATVKIELHGFRKIISNDATSLTLDRALLSVTTTDRWYVIQGASTFVEITGHGLTAAVTDAKSLRNSVVYFACGPANQMRRMREYNNAGVWTREFAEDTQSTAGGALPGANFLLQAYDQLNGVVLYKVVNGDLGFIAKAPAADWGTNLVFGTEIKIGFDNWEDLSGACEYDGKIAVTAMDSLWLVKNGTPEKVSIDMENQWTYNTGRRPTVMPPYLVFPFGNRIQRMYQNIVESFGPERDSGVPKVYDGNIQDSLSLVGALAIAKSGGTMGQYDTNAEGGAFLYRDGGWHPLAFTGLGSNMTALWYQHCEDEIDLIWFGDHNGLWYMYLPRQWDYTFDPRYNQTNRIEEDGWFISGWYDTGRLLPAKWWDFITIFASNLSATSGRKMRIYYQVSDGEEYAIENLAINWTFAEEITSGYNNTISLNKQGRRVRFLFVLLGDGDSTPELEGYSVNYLSRDDDAESWQMTIRIKDHGFDQQDQPEEWVLSKDQIDTLNYWARTVKPLTMNSWFEPWDNREVLIERPGLTPLEHTPEGEETYYGNMVLLGIEEPAEDPPDTVISCPLTAPANGPYSIVLSGTIQPDDTIALFGAANYIIRTAGHVNGTTYSINGTWFTKDVNGNWVETTTDDFYDVYALDKYGKVVAVGVHNAVTNSNVRTGTFAATVATRIASIEVHIHGTAFRPSVAIRDGYTPHFWMNSSLNKGDLTWGYTEYGVWARVDNWRIGPWQATASGWDSVSWFAGSLIYFGEDGQYINQTFNVRQMAAIVAGGTITAEKLFGQYEECPIVNNRDTWVTKWEDDFADFQNGSYTTALKETTVMPDTTNPDGRSKVGASMQYQLHIPNSGVVDIGMTNLIWINFPPTKKITITGAALSNVCP